MRSLLKQLTVLMSLVIFVGCSSDDPIPAPEPEKPDPKPETTKVYYISPTGEDTNNGLTSNTPWKTFAKVLASIKPGDVVNLMNGNYNTSLGPLIELLPIHSGTEDKYITFKAMDGHKPVIVAYGNVWNAMIINASYVIVDGIEFMGYNQYLTYEDAYQVYEEYMAGGRDWAKIAAYNTNAVTIGGPSKDSKLPHHVIVRNCTVHDFPGGGLSAIQADYVTFENNMVYNNAWYMMYGGSGISVLCPYNSDENSADYKIVIKNNFCHTNKTMIPWNNIQKLSDGNGIIIDINNRPYDGGVIEDGKPYGGRTLVQGNVSINNGGSGIHSFKANHVDILYNTAYHNGTVVGYADIYSNQCTNVNILNNIMYARADNACNEKPGVESEVYDYNVYYGGKVKYQGPNDIVADPKFVKLDLNRLVGDFRLQVDSPAKGTASTAGKNRGAYQ